jgi:N-acetyl-anhydromuramyl-L-alanine amidase AmpD
MSDPTAFQFDLPSTGRPKWFPLPEPYYPDADWYSVNRATDRIYNTVTGIRAVVVHATAGWATSHALDHWRDVKASAHWVVPDEDEGAHGKHVWAVVRESRAAWHVNNSRSHKDVWNGATKVNHWSVGIEIVNTQDVQNYTDPFSDWQIRMTALIVRRCWARYPNLRHIVSHAKLDPTRRADLTRTP